MACSVSAALHSLSTWWHPNIEEELYAFFFFFFESSALKFGNSPVNSREMDFGFGQLCISILNYNYEEYT